MKKVLLYSIAPQHLVNILNGLKTIEVRKRDLPQWAKDKIARGEIVEGYGYCTKGGGILSNDIGFYTIYHMPPRYKRKTDLNGKVVVKFEVSYVYKYKAKIHKGYSRGYNVSENIMKKMRLDNFDLEQYGGISDLYAHHLNNIQPVNMELGEFEVWYGGEESFYPLKRASQSFQTVWVKGE